MIVFRFFINNSFLKYSSHPITIPKSQVNYKNLIADNLDIGDFILLLPKGEILKGHIYRGISGYGEYYQIRIYPDQQFPSYLLLNDQLIVILFRYNRKSYCILEYDQK